MNLIPDICRSYQYKTQGIDMVKDWHYLYIYAMAVICGLMLVLLPIIYVVGFFVCGLAGWFGIIWR